ncbi:hypothetical protein [Thalassococcus sp. S3]|uniref:hypothetical protein n=1 Tax=Thalassococcus sp. S3 TaxID=2017482 RepID=UPI0010246E25|nr:hypothetical protein [Thalassococcus sp. S3]QBF33418.1 hypothetical protein CFI11_19700 [Thalassococcus sp. S3]
MGQVTSAIGPGAPTFQSGAPETTSSEKEAAPRVLQVFRSAIFKGREVLLYEKRIADTGKYEVRLQTLHPDQRKVDDMLVATQDAPAKDSDFGYSSDMTRKLKETVRRMNGRGNVVDPKGDVNVGNPWDALVGGSLDLLVGTGQTILGLPEKLIDSSVAFGGSLGAMAEATFSGITGLDAPTNGLSNTLNVERRAQFGEDSSVDNFFDGIRRDAAKNVGADPDSFMFKAGEFLSMFVPSGKKAKGKSSPDGRPVGAPGGPTLNRGLAPDFVRDVKAGIETAPKAQVVETVRSMTPEFIEGMRQRTPDVFKALVDRLTQFSGDPDAGAALARLSPRTAAVVPKVTGDQVSPPRLRPASDVPQTRPATGMTGEELAVKIGKAAYPFSGFQPLVYGDVTAGQQQAMIDNGGQNRLVSIAIPFSYQDPGGLVTDGALLYRGIDVGAVGQGFAGALKNLNASASFDVSEDALAVLAGSGLSKKGIDQRIKATTEQSEDRTEGARPSQPQPPDTQAPPSEAGGDGGSNGGGIRRPGTAAPEPDPEENRPRTQPPQFGLTPAGLISPSLDAARKNTPTGPSAPFVAVTPITQEGVNVPDPTGASNGFTVTPSGRVARNDPPPVQSETVPSFPDATDSPDFSDQYRPIYRGAMRGVRSQMAARARALEDAHRANRDLVKQAKRLVSDQRASLREAERELRKWDQDPSPIRDRPRADLVANVEARKAELEDATHVLAGAEKRVRDNDIRVLSPSLGLSVADLDRAAGQGPSGLEYGELHRSAPFFNTRTIKSLFKNRAAIGQAISNGDMTRLRQLIGEAMGLSMHNLQGLQSPTLATDNVGQALARADDLVPQADLPLTATNTQLKRSYLQITSQTLHARPDLFLPVIRDGVTNYRLNVEPVDLPTGQSGFFGSSRSEQYYRLGADWDIDKAAQITEVPFIMRNQQEWKRSDGADMRIPKGAILPKEFVDAVNGRIGNVEANLRIFSAPGKPLSEGWKVDIPFENRLDRRVNEAAGGTRTTPEGENGTPINPVDVLTAPLKLEGQHTIRSIKTFSIGAVVDDVLRLVSGGPGGQQAFLAQHPEIAATAFLIKRVFPKAQVVTGALPRPLETPSARMEEGPVRVELLTPAGDAVTPAFNPKRILKINDTGRLKSDADLANGGRSEPTRRGHVTPSPIGRLESIKVGAPDGQTRDQTLVLINKSSYATMVPDALAIALEGGALPRGGKAAISDYLQSLPKGPETALSQIDFERLHLLLEQQTEGTSVRGMVRVELLKLMRAMRDADISTGIGISSQ